MQNTPYALIVNIAVLLVKVNTELEPVPLTRCESIIYLVEDFRTNILGNPTVMQVYGDSINHVLHEIEEHLSISIDNEEDVRRLSCDIADASSMSDLAEVLNLDENILRDEIKLISSTADESLRMFAKYAIDIKKVHRWIKKSGFPDEWPLNVTKEETKKLLKRNPEMAERFLIYSGSWSLDIDINDRANILTNSTSLDEYLEQMDLQYLIDYPDNLESNLELPRSLKLKRGMLDYVRGLTTYRAVYSIIIELDLSSLP